MKNQSNYEKGKEYEDFVEKIYNVISEADNIKNKKPLIKLERNVTLPCKSGATAEFDIYWEYQFGEILHKVAIECKNYNSAIAIGKMRDFYMKLQDVGGIRGIFVAKNAFQEGAVKLAKQYDIKLINLREVQEKD